MTDLLMHPAVEGIKRANNGMRANFFGYLATTECSLSTKS
jgi:hypothetical protein